VSIGLGGVGFHRPVGMTENKGGSREGFVVEEIVEENSAGILN